MVDDRTFEGDQRSRLARADNVESDREKTGEGDQRGEREAQPRTLREYR